jgi:D-apionolactonase
MSSQAEGPPDGAPLVHAAPELAIPLRAGPLRLVFDRGGLRWIRLGAREVLRGIYVALRDERWRTLPARLEDLEIEAEPEAFRVRFLARHAAGGIRFDWRGLVEGGADGRIAFSMDGNAGAPFRRNRIGFCVLHPAEACAGRPCIVETVDGDRASSVFPALVAPHPPFRMVRAILHEVSPGVEAEVRMEGDVFETEDQRNWSDASFKTYSTPLHLPHPVEVPEGARVAQSVTLRLFGVTSEPVREAAATVPGALPKRRNSSEPVVVRLPHAGGRVRPALGLGGAALGALAPADAAPLKAAGLDHVRADLRPGSPGWEAGLELAVANARALGVPLEVALFLPDEPEAALRDLAARARPLRPRVASWLPFRASDSTTAEGLAAAARAALAGVDAAALFGGGADAHFVELNRRRPPHRGLDRLVFALSPQAHAFDDATLFECLASLRPMADTARSISGGGAVGISPVTLRPRDASSIDPAPPPFTDDPRQASTLAAAWTLAFIAAAAEAGIASLTLFELWGPRGVVQGGVSFPALHALADVLALPGATVLPARSRRPERVQVLALRAGGRLRLFLANPTADAHRVRIEGLGGPARRAPLGQGPAGEEAEAELELAPREVLRVDAPLAGG